jgi:16S rRNA (uracil1498-N3)-methyltransferase
MVPGDELTITDGKGILYLARITSSDIKKCAFEILNKKKLLRKNYNIHIAIAPTKNADRMEWFVEKAIEIGIDEISFVHCQNSERKAINLERIEKIAISALKQSQQAWLPKLNATQSFNEILNNSADQKFIAVVDSTNPVHLKSLAIARKKYCVLIGPEGDFSSSELASALQHDYLKISLGSNRLRTETAGLVACHSLQLVNS